MTRWLVAFTLTLMLAAPAQASHIILDGQAVPELGARASKTKVLVVESSDFECPYCARVSKTLKELVERYPDEVTIAYMHNPLGFHKKARGAALASIAAQRQGKFWPMHDRMFENYRRLEKSSLLEYARGLGLNMRRFKKDMDDPKLGSFVDRNQRIVVGLGARGTPSFFINGRSLKGAQPIEKFVEVIEEEIAAANAAGTAGVRWIRKRTRANNNDAYQYLFAGKKPEAIPERKPRKPRPPDETVYRVQVEPDVDAWTGGADALVTLVVFSEFQCPFCSRIVPTLDQIKKTYGDKVRLVFKHNPLPGHKDALGAAVASLCAERQGKFWAMHDHLFRNQKDLGVDSLHDHARAARLDMRRFERCLDANHTSADHEGGRPVWKGPLVSQVIRDQELAAKVNARGTPNTFVNGRKVTGAKPFEEFKSIIDEEMKKASAMVRGGASRKGLYEAIVGKGKLILPLDETVHSIDTRRAARVGYSTAPVQIVVFGDYQCPFCSRVSAPLKAVKHHYGDRASLVFMNFPLNFHKEAKSAALAALCAKDQGHFMEMHDALYARQKELAPDIYGPLAEGIGLEMRAFHRCMASKKHDAQVQDEMSEGRKAKVRGTPSVYINGRKFQPSQGYTKEALVRIIDKYVLGATPGRAGDLSPTLGLCTKACENLTRIVSKELPSFLGIEQKAQMFADCPQECLKDATLGEVKCMIAASTSQDIDTCTED